MFPINNFLPKKRNKTSETLAGVLFLIIVLGGLLVTYYLKKQKEAAENDLKYIPTPHRVVESVDVMGHREVKGYDKSDRLITITEYKGDRKTINKVKVYKPETGKHFKTVHFYEGLINTIYNYDVKTGNYEKATHYYKESIISETFYNPQTNNRTKDISYSTLDGSLYSITEYNSLTDAKIKTTYYNKDGTIESVK